MDMDNDGFSAGWELGDPCGNWTANGPNTTWSNDISHPGNSSSFPVTRKVDWSICAGGKNPCESTEVQESIEYLKYKIKLLEQKQQEKFHSQHHHNHQHSLDSTEDNKNTEGSTVTKDNNNNNRLLRG